MKEIFKTSGILIDDPNIKLTKHADGSLLLTDNFVSVKLKDIIGGTVVIDPAVVVQLEAADWTYDGDNSVYTVDVPHDFGLSGNERAQVLVVTTDLDYVVITLDYVQVKENSVYLKSATALDMFISMKRI